MRNILRILFMVVCLFISMGPVLAQWVQTNGPYGGYVNAFVVSGSNLFAGTNGAGVFLSSDFGKNWSAENSGLAGAYIYCFAVNGDYVFAGTDQGIFRSTDGGRNWVPTNAEYSTVSLAVKGASLFAGFSNSGLSLSTDNGVSWTPASAGLPETQWDFDNSAEVDWIAASGRNVIAGTRAMGLYLSTNDGTNWTAVSSTATAGMGVTSLIANGGKVFVALGSGIAVSTDNGTNWEKADSGSYSYGFLGIALAAGDSNVYAAGSGGIALSTDNGVTWNFKNVNAGGENMQVRCLAVIQGNLVAGTNGSGIFLSTDNGTSWNSSSAGMSAKTIYLLAAVQDSSGTGNAKLFAGTDYGGGVSISTDNGTSWSYVESSQLLYSNVNALYPSGGRLFSAAGGVLFSSDDGSTWAWIQPDSGLVVSNAQCLAAAGPCVIAGAGYGASLFPGYLFRPTFNGTGWTGWEGVGYGLPDAPVWTLAVSDTTIFAGVESNGNSLFRSTDYGTTWTAAGSGLGITFVLSLAVSGSNIFAGTDNGVFLSTDGANTWTGPGKATENSHIWCLAVSGTNLFAGTDSSIFLSTDNGTSWTQVNSGLPGTRIHCLTVSGSDLFVGTDYRGVWRRPLSDMPTSVQKLLTDLPTRFSLEQNYPNLFNPTTVISYQLPGNSFVTLKIYDVLGREVKTLVNERQTAGNHSVSLSASNLPSGVYFYRLQAGTFTQTKKLVVIK